jgi:hypothetical protein
LFQANAFGIIAPSLTSGLDSANASNIGKSIVGFLSTSLPGRNPLSRIRGVSVSG